MKIAICSLGADLTSQVSPTFGRCPYFLIIDIDTQDFKAVSNAAFASQRGAGVGAAQTIASEKVEMVICVNFGPNAFSVLGAAGIKLYTVTPGITIQEAINQYQQGKLIEAEVPLARGRFGMRRGFGRRGW